MSTNMKAVCTRGDIYTAQWRQRQSEAGKKKMTPEMRSHISKKVKAAWERGEFDDRDWEEFGRAVSAAWANGNYDGVFQSPTQPELAVTGALEAAGIDHVFQYRPPGWGGGLYDWFVKPNILIEEHGTYWHGSLEHYTEEKLHERVKRSRANDIKKAEWAETNGYHLVVIWEHEINELGAWPLIRNRILPLLTEEKA